RETSARAGGCLRSGKPQRGRVKRHGLNLRPSRAGSASMVKVRPVRRIDGRVRIGRMIEELITRMAALLEPLEARGDKRRYFHATYQRTTVAVAGELKRGGFADPDWVERWDVVFAELYLDALEADMAGRRPSRPWAIAFGAPDGLPPLRHV